MMDQIALKELLYKMADDQLIYGHRNSEWIGLGPLLEEDISFASIAQDKVGQSRVLYNLLQQLGEADPNTVAFMRNATQFHNCHLVELPCPTYEMALMRHFLFDEAEAVRFESLRASTQPDLAAFASKFSGEIKYHTLHGRSMLKRLMTGSEEAFDKLSSAFVDVWPYCGGIFEPSIHEAELSQEGIIEPETVLRQRWLDRINAYLPLWASIQISPFLAT